MAAISSLIAVGSAALGAGASMYASSQQSKAAKQAAAAQQRASDQSLAFQRQALQQQTQLNQPFTQAGYSALDAVMAQFGLPGTSPGSAGQPDWNAYAQMGDVGELKAILAGQMVGNRRQQEFLQGYAQNGAGRPLEQYHWEVAGRPAGWTLPTIQAQAAQAPAPMATDPTAPGGYSIGPRPTMPKLDVSLDAYVPSPDYQHQLTEGSRTVNSNFGAKGLLQSGAAMKALQEFGQNLALGDYGQWRDYTTGQYNVDRNVLNQNYESDRGYLAGRYDQRTNNLLRVAGLGQASANNQAAGQQTFANNAGNILGANALAQGQSYYDQADARASGVNSLVGSVTGLLKGIGTSYRPNMTYTVPQAPNLNTSILANRSAISTAIPNVPNIYR